jgi:predicted nucleic acid-binding protein
MYVLDTNVVSEIRKIKSGRADRGLEEWAQELEMDQAFISAITIQELEHGVLLAERRDPAAGDILRRWLESDVMQAFSGRILPVDLAVARQAARFHVPDPAPVQVALIAATALVRRMTVVTRNTRDFERFGGLSILNPWSPTTES